MRCLLLDCNEFDEQKCRVTLEIIFKEMYFCNFRDFACDASEQYFVV